MTGRTVFHAALEFVAIAFEIFLVGISAQPIKLTAEVPAVFNFGVGQLVVNWAV
jgi:hypothetical protein